MTPTMTGMPRPEDDGQATTTTTTAFDEADPMNDEKKECDVPEESAETVLGDGDEDDYDDVEGGDEESTTTSKSTSTRRRKKKGGFRKAPQAPRRFKSPYILFSISKMAEYKTSTDNVQVTSISRKIAQDWKALSPAERKKWDQIALQDKMRYNAEKKLYTGPWQVPSKRSRKDPSAPKRPPSAFLFYCQTQRRELKRENPGMKNTDISKLLGEQWKNAPMEVRRPHIEREQRERETYKSKIAAWRSQRQQEETFSRQRRQAVAEQYIRSGAYPMPTVSGYPSPLVSNWPAAQPTMSCAGALSPHPPFMVSMPPPGAFLPPPMSGAATQLPGSGSSCASSRFSPNPAAPAGLPNIYAGTPTSFQPLHLGTPASAQNLGSTAESLSVPPLSAPSPAPTNAAASMMRKVDPSAMATAARNGSSEQKYPQQDPSQQKQQRAVATQQRKVPAAASASGTVPGHKLNESSSNNPDISFQDRGFPFMPFDSDSGLTDNPLATSNDNQWLPSLLYGDASFDPANPLLLESHSVGDVVAD